MSRAAKFEHRFVRSAPRELEDGVLYVSVEFSTALHSCACGCGSRIVTPFSPSDWSMVFDGQFVSLNPSIGNWSLPCRSHYFIHKGNVQWAGSWSDEMVQHNRKRGRMRKRPDQNADDALSVSFPAKLAKAPWHVRVWRWLMSRL